MPPSRSTRWCPELSRTRPHSLPCGAPTCKPPAQAACRAQLPGFCTAAAKTSSTRGQPPPSLSKHRWYDLQPRSEPYRCAGTSLLPASSDAASMAMVHGMGERHEWTGVVARLDRPFEETAVLTLTDHKSATSHQPCHAVPCGGPSSQMQCLYRNAHGSHASPPLHYTVTYVTGTLAGLRGARVPHNRANRKPTTRRGDARFAAHQATWRRSRCRCP